jgi:hypothetical protein
MTDRVFVRPGVRVDQCSGIRFGRAIIGYGSRSVPPPRRGRKYWNRKAKVIWQFIAEFPKVQHPPIVPADKENEKELRTDD